MIERKLDEIIRKNLFKGKALMTLGARQIGSQRRSVCRMKIPRDLSGQSLIKSLNRPFSKM